MDDWSKQDFINWAKWRIRTFEVCRENEKKGKRSELPDHPLSELDLRIWLAHQDGESLSEIGRKQYPRQWKKGKGKRDNQTAISRIRRAIERVEKFLNRGKRGFAYPKKWQDQLNEVLNNVLFR